MGYRKDLQVASTWTNQLHISATSKGIGMNSTVLWIIAVILAVVGIVQLVQGQILLGIVFIIGACLVGPGGYSVFKNRS